ncbi:MAG: hypothetical protein AAF590_11170 [Pseudomonadota bacterium]
MNDQSYDQTDTASRDANRPYDRHRDGALEIAIWRAVTDKGVAYNTEMKRSYKDDQGEWQSTHAIPERDLLKAARLQEQAYTSIQMAREYDRVQKQERQAANRGGQNAAVSRNNSQDYGRER